MAGGYKKITGKDGKLFTKDDPRINRTGRPCKLPDLDELMREVLGEEQHGRTAMQMILLALRQKAMKGDVRATELLLDRAYGKLTVTKEIDLNLANLTEADIDKILDKLSDNENSKANGS